MKQKLHIILSLSLLLALVLCGCAAKVELSGGTVKNKAQSITAIVTPEDLQKLDSFEKLVSADFSGSTCYDALLAWAEKHPLVETTYTVAFPCGVTVDNRCTELALTGLDDEASEETLDLLAYLPMLKSVNLGSEEDGLSPASALRFSDTYPDIDFVYHCLLLGKDSQLKETFLDMTNCSPSEIKNALSTIACLRDLKRIRLGSADREDAPSWPVVFSLRQAIPANTIIHYNFSLYGLPFSLEDREMDLSYIQVTDEGQEILAAARCMRNLELLNMDSCGVSNESMAKIRDALPETEVIWRINFGQSYTALTNETRILASSPSVGGVLSNADFAVFRYFTKIKYLDIGHNESLTDLSFVHYMPDLEVLIIAMNPLGDLTPLAECENLEYLELFYSNTADLSPLAGLKNLKHLNVGHCPYLTDISPIYDLELQRFYLGTFQYCPVPAEQVDHYRELHPDCEVDNELWESSEGAWRRAANLEGEELEWYMEQPYYREDRKLYAPRYALLRDQMEYDGLLYSTKWNDPTYRFVSWFQ